MKLVKKLFWVLITGFIVLNVVACFHAYKFTHFIDGNIERTANPADLSIMDKVKTLFLGINNPRPVNNQFPKQEYEVVRLSGSKEIECWFIKAENALGSVILFHGYFGKKSSMLEKSDEFLSLGYNTLLVDFMGSGGSEGNQTTVGFMEAEQVKSSYEYLQQLGEENVILFGTSMGSVAIMKAINDYQLSPSVIIIESPFGSMYETVVTRFHTMNIPTFPMAGLLVFWGGVQGGFWAFDHNPREYARNISCPTLLLYGEQDEKVSRKEIDEIFNNLNGEKQLITYPLAGHENYLIQYHDEWVRDVSAFLDEEHDVEKKMVSR